MDVGEAPVDAVVPPGEPRVVEAQQVEHRGVDVVDRRGVVAVERLVAPLVAGTVGDAAADAAAAQPGGEHERVVVAPPAPLRARHPPELRGPHHDRVVQQAALLEVADQRRRPVGHPRRQRAVVAFDVFVGVPVAPREAIVVAAPHLHEAHPALEEAPRGEALEGEVPSLLGGVDLRRPHGRHAVETIQREHVVGLVGQRQRLGGGQLHPRRQLVGADPGLEPGIAGARGEVAAVEPGQCRARGGVGLRGDERGGGAEVGDRRGAPGRDDGTGVLRGEEPGVPVLHPVGGIAAVIGEDDERGEVLVVAAQRVAHPGAGAGETGEHEAGRLEERGRGVDPRRAHHVVDERDPVDHAPQRRHHVGQLLAARPVPTERPDRREPGPEAVLERLHRLAEVARLAVPFHQLRLVVEKIDVAGRPRHEQLHDSFGPRRVNEGRMRRATVGPGPLRLEGREGQAPQAAAAGGQPVAARTRPLGKGGGGCR